VLTLLSSLENEMRITVARKLNIASRFKDSSVVAHYWKSGVRALQGTQ
jgi:hypothetical protein